MIPEFSPPAEHAAAAVPSRIHAPGEMAGLVRTHDWSATPLGSLENWSPELLAIVNLVLSSIVPMVIYWGPEMCMIYNDGFRPFTSNKHPRSLGQSARMVWREAWHILGGEFEAILERGESISQNDLLVPIEQDGVLRDLYFTYSSSPFYQESRIAGFVVVCQERTEAVLAARERDSLAQQLHQVLEVTSDSVLSIDRDWRISYMNPKARQAAGPAGDVLGKNFWQSFPAAVYMGSPFLKHYYAAMDKAQPADFEAFYPEPLNIWVDVQVRPTAAGIVLFFRDVTAQKRAAEELRQTAAALAASEEELRWTVKLSVQVPWTADPEGAILDFGESWLQLTGLTRHEALGDGWVQLQHPEDRQPMIDCWLHAVQSGTPYDFEHRLRTTSGDYRWMRSRAFPRRDAAGNILKWYGSTEDIETRKKAEDVVRTTEKLAAVGRLASSIAHEINNPLESVTNLLYLASGSKDLPGDAREYLELAERELRRVSVITNQTLRFHKQSTSPKCVACEDLIGGALSIYQGRLVNSGIQVDKRKRAQRPVLCFDGEIRQVLNNLIGNSIDAMPAGGRLLLRSREATHLPTGRRGLVLTVADTGTGIRPDVMQKIFQPFFTTKGIGGTGLGLWVTKEILDRHHGVLHVRSRHTEPHRGTVFTLFLPYDLPAGDPANPGPEASVDLPQYGIAQPMGGTEKLAMADGT